MTAPLGRPPEPPSAEVREPGQVVAPRLDAWGLAIRIVAVAVLVAIALWLVVALRAILIQVLLGVILASGLEPLVERLYRAGLPRAISVLSIYSAFVLAVVLGAILVVPPVLTEIAVVMEHAPQYADQLAQLLVELRQRFPFLPPFDQQLAEQLRGLSSQLGALAAQALVVARFALSIASGVMNAFLLLLITLYLVVDGTRIREYFVSFAPLQERARLRRMSDRIGQRMGGWLLGQLGLSASVGFVTFVGLTLLGMPGAALLAVVAAIGEVIPIVGPVLSAVPAVVVAATQSPLLALLTLGLYVLIQQIENNLLVPRIMGRAVQLHPLAVVLALLVGSELLGIVGAVVAVPVAAAIAVLLDEVRAARVQPLELPAPPAPAGPATRAAGWEEAPRNV